MQAPVAPQPTQRTAEQERARAAAKQAEKELWERTRGAGSAVFKLAEAGRIKPGLRGGKQENEQSTPSSSSVNHTFDQTNFTSVRAKSKSRHPITDNWTAEDVLPTLEEVQSTLYEPVEVPSADVLLSRGICDYTLIPKTLGRGKFSTVFVGSKNGELTAIKHTALFPHHQLIATRLLREPTLLAELPPHPNLVTVKETIRTPGHFYLVEEFLDGYVTLEALLPILCPVQPHILPIHAAEKILAQLLSAVHAIHVPLQICHRDIKPENILVHPQTLQLKLLDFGLATHFSKSEPKLSTCCGSPAFHCPEIVKALASPPGSVNYMGPEVDAWTCGVTMLRCLTGARFPLGASHSSLRGMAIRAQRAVANINDPAMREKVAALLDMDGNRRMAKFEELVREQEGFMDQFDRSAKKFKSTTFIPSSPTHSIRLPLLENSSDNHGYESPNGFATPVSASRRTTPSNSRAPSPARSTAFGGMNGNGGASNTTLVALNPTHQPPERVVSFIKYCLRCAGILYHTWPDISGMTKTPKPSFFGPQTPILPTTSVSSAFAEAVGTPLDASTNPSTPLFPPSYTNWEDRNDGHAHVQIFQCVIELPEDKGERDGRGGFGQMSLVQSIMAAFGRKPSQTTTPTLNQNHATYSKNPSTSPDTRPQGRRSVSSPAPPNRNAHTPTMPSKDGTMRCLTFHLIIKFPKQQHQQQSMARQAMSRSSSYFGNAQQHANLHQPSAQYGKRSRASSAAGVLAHDIKENEEGYHSGSRERRERKNDDFETFGHVEGRRYDTLVEESSNTMEKIDGNAADSLNMESLSREGKSHSTQSNIQQPFPRMPNRSPSTSRPASRNRARNGRGMQKRSKVLIQVTDERAVPMIRECLSVGGTLESHEIDENRSSQNLNVTIEGLQGSFSGQNSLSKQSRRKNRNSAAFPIKAWPVTSSESVSVPQSPILSRHSTDLWEGKGQEKNEESEEEERPRGRAMTSIRGRQASEETVVATSDKNNTLRAAPSLLSTVPLREESPPNDNLRQNIDSLQRTLQTIINLSKNSNRSGSSESPTYKSNVSSPNVEARFSDIQTTFDGRQEGLLAQVRTILLDISNSFQRAVKEDEKAFLDLVSPISFEIFNALSPALGLVPMEKIGLPDSSTAKEEAGESTTLRGMAMAAFEIFSQHASAREIFMAAQERMESLSANSINNNEDDESIPQKEENAKDDEKKNGIHLELKDLPTMGKFTRPRLSLWSPSLELAGLLHILTRTLPRIKTQKPISFVQPLITLIPRCARSSLQSQLFQSKSNSDANTPTSNTRTSSNEDLFSIKSYGKDSSSSSRENTERAACEITLGLCSLLRSMVQWTQSSDKDIISSMNETTTTLLLTSMIVLIPQMPKSHNEVYLSDFYFYQWKPKYKINPPSPSKINETSELDKSNPDALSLCSLAWKELNKLVTEFSLDIEGQAFDRPRYEDRFKKVAEDEKFDSNTNKSMEVDQAALIAAKTMGAFMLHIHILARCTDLVGTNNNPDEWKAEIGLEKLQRSMGMLVACLGASLPASISQDGSQYLGGVAQLPDVALTWVIWCMEAVEREKGENKIMIQLSSEEALIFIQTLSSHSALSPRPMARHISLRIVQFALQNMVEQDLACELVHDLICDSAYPQLSAASIGLVRQFISFELDDEKYKFANRSFIDTIFKKVFTLSDGAEVLPNITNEESEIEVKAGQIRSYLDDHASRIGESLSFIYLLLTKDVKNITGIKDEEKIGSIKRDLIEPLNDWLESVSQLLKTQIASIPSNNSVDNLVDIQMGISILKMSFERAKEALSPL